MQKLLVIKLFCAYQLQGKFTVLNSSTFQEISLCITSDRQTYNYIILFLHGATAPTWD